MGFEVPIRTAMLEFTEHEGLEVRVALDVPMQMFFDFTHMVDSNDMAEVEKAVREFADTALIEWNVTIKGEQIPPTGDGITRLPLGFAKDILMGWLRSIAEAPAPLVQPSTNGTQSPAESAPTEPLSPSPQDSRRSN